MARIEYLRHKRVATTADDGISDIQTQRDWNGDAHGQIGAFGFDGVTVTLVTDVASPTNTETQLVIAAESGVTDSLVTLTATNYQTHDEVRLIADAGDTITVTNAGNIVTNSGANVILSEDIPMILKFDGTNFFQFAGKDYATLAGTEVLSGKTFTLPQINDTSADHQYIFGVNELVADRTVIFPLLAGNRTFVFADKGTDAASGDVVTLTITGHYFDITGTTTINHINNTNWEIGSVVHLQFDGIVTVNHNTGSEVSDEASIILGDATNFTTAAGNTLTLILESSTKWRELSRNSGTGGGNEFVDNVFRINDDGDPTKQIAFQANGITTSTTRTLTVPDVNMTLHGKEATNTFDLEQILNEIAKPADPAATFVKVYPKLVDANNSGLFIIQNIGGTMTEVRIS